MCLAGFNVAQVGVGTAERVGGFSKRPVPSTTEHPERFLRRGIVQHAGNYTAILRVVKRFIANYAVFR